MDQKTITLKGLILFCALLFFFKSTNLCGQNQFGIDLDVLFEDLLSSSDLNDQGDLELVKEDLYQFLGNPIDLNKCEAEDLLVIPFFDHALAHSVCSTVKSKSASNHAELEHLFNDELEYSYFKLFSSFNNRLGFLPEKFEVTSQLGTDLQERKGYRLNKFAGSPLYSKIRINASTQIGTRYSILSENDAGEAFNLSSNRLGFDYLSASISHPLGQRTHLIAGDFRIRMGSGISMGGSNFSNLVKPIRIGRSIFSAKQFTSSDENKAMRGLLLTQQFGPMQILGAVSRRRIDATLKLDPFGAVVITSFGKSGYHRTEGELARKSTVLWTNGLIGASLKWWRSNRFIAFGFLHLKGGWSAKFASSQREDLKAIPEFTEYLINSVSSMGQWRWLSFQADIARSKTGLLASNVGVKMSTKLTKTSLQYRDYDPGFFSPFAASHDRHGLDSNNEKGYRASLSLRLPFRLKAEGGLDHYQTYAPIYSSKAAVIGSRRALSLTKEFKNGIGFRVRSQGRELSEIGELYINSYSSSDLQLKLKAGEHLHFKTLFSISKHRKKDEPDAEGENSKGRALSLDLDWRSGSTRLQFGGKYFNTDDYNARIYHYETSVTDHFYIPALSGRGSRYSFLLSKNLSEKVGLQFKWAMWLYKDRNTISSGNQEVSGNKLSQIRLLISWKI